MLPYIFAERKMSTHHLNKTSESLEEAAHYVKLLDGS